MKSGTSPIAISTELGNRLKQARLNLNLTQDELAEQAGLGRKVVIRAEQGNVTLVNFVSMMVAMGIDQSLDLFLPPQPISPIELAKLQGKQRQRASGSIKDGTVKGLKW